MSISYPVSVPDHRFASMSMRLRRANAMTESTFTLQQQVNQYTGAVWEAEITLPPMSYADAKKWEAFILSLRGMRGTFLMGNPLHTDLSGTATGIQLDGQGVIRDTSINITGSASGTIKAGDYFQIGTGSDAHIHAVVQDETLDGTGAGSIDIEPPLRTTYADNTSLDFTLPKGVWRLSSNDIGWNIDTASMYGFTIPCIEAI